MDASSAEGAKALEPVEEAKKLVHALNSPGNAPIAKTIQERLQELQKSESGWVVADGLLSSNDPNTRFFGALTLTVKINQDWDTIGDQKAKEELLARLINYFVVQANKAETSVVMRKFMTTMSTFFLKPNAPWTHCVRHAAMSLANGGYVPEVQCDLASFQNLALPHLDYGSIIALLTFSTTLAEESSRLLRYEHSVSERLKQNLDDAFYLVEFVFRKLLSNGGATVVPSELPEKSCETAIEAIKSLQAWLAIARSLHPNPEEGNTRPPLDYVVQLLTSPRVASASMELLAELLDSQPMPLGLGHLQSILDFLTGKSAEQYTVSLLEGDYDDDKMRFLDLLLRYATSTQLDLLSGQVSDQHQSILVLLKSLLCGRGFPGVDDKACPMVLQFWTGAAEELDVSVLQDGEELPERVKGEFGQVIANCYNKLQCPQSDVLQDWDEDDMKNFIEFRRDFADFLLVVFPLLGLEIIKQLVQFAVSYLGSMEWDRAEVAVFCIASLSEISAVADSSYGDDILNHLFYSPQFEELCFGRSPMSTRSRQTLCNMVARYNAYFERNQTLIPRIMTFLFSALETPHCDQAASKSISVLCQNCRQALPVYVNEFIDKFDQLRSNPATSSPTLERVSTGIAAVVQALQGDDQKAACLSRLLGPLYQLAEQARQDIQNNQYEDGLAKGLMSMRCTASVGKGFRSPNDIVTIDLASENASLNEQNFWNSSEHGISVQSTIVQIVDILMITFASDSGMIDAACDVLKAGYTERVPGPYVLPPQISVRFVKAVDITSPQFPTVMSTASAFLASHASHAAEIRGEAIELIMHVYEVICFMNENPEQYDPDVAHSCLDFLNSLFPNHRDAFFSLLGHQLPNRPPTIPTILSFSQAILQRPDPLPLRASAAFWSTLLNLVDPPAEFQPSGSRHDPNARSSYFDAVLQSLAEILIHQISGNCSRSDIDHFCEVVKKYIFKYQLSAKFHFTNILDSMENGANSASGDVTRRISGRINVPPKAERDKFLKMILSLRGGRMTNQVVKDYWVLCRGKGFGYAR